MSISGADIRRCFALEIVCEGYKKSMRKDSDNAKLLEPGELPSKRKILVVEDNELNENSTIRKFRIVQNEGERQITIIYK